MDELKTGIHTIEFIAPKGFRLDRLPDRYKAAIRHEKKRQRYAMTITRLPGMDEYNSIANTQAAINEAFDAFSQYTEDRCRMTRADYRFDDHAHDFAHSLPMMTVLVNLIAFTSGDMGRMWISNDGFGNIISVRCMPAGDDKAEKLGAEYYDKERQMGTDEFGKARFELRRLNLDGEGVRYAVKEWRDLLVSITRDQYRAMLEEHARRIASDRKPDEPMEDIRKRGRPLLIAKEEEGIFYKLIDSGRSNYPESKRRNLPQWSDVKAQIDSMAALMKRDLDAPLTYDGSPENGEENDPF